ncbi:DDE-type integrase/transposase/recombinase [bacterium]|nr:DDE-type integrase/transposase/recombinase [bacterium]
MERFYARTEITRQGFARAISRRMEEDLNWSVIENSVCAYRKNKDHRAGSRSLYYNLNIKNKFGIGVNKFEQLLSDRGLCLAPQRVRVVTTKSSKQSWNYPNLVDGLVVNGINQVVVGDITYIYVNGQRYFLFCLTDVYSARIVGHCVSRNMRAIEAKQAADMWIRLRRPENLVGCIHHTDGGSQYFSELYLGLLNGLEVDISRAKTCLENGYAEQRNGLIKHHLLPTISVSGKDVPDRQIEQILKTYNHERKQQRLGWLTPVAFEKKVAEMKHKPKIKLHDFQNNENGF